MKKTVTILTIFVLSLCCMFLMVGCEFDYSSDTETSKKNLERLIDCLEKNDRDGVKSLFAPKRISDIEDFDDDVDELLSYFVGDFVSHDFNLPATFDDIHKGDKKKWYIIGANVTTTSGVYRFSMYWCQEDTTDSSNVGIWSLFVFNHADNPLYDFSFYGDSDWDDPNRKGIYIVQPYKYIEMTMNIFQSANIEYIKALFASQAIGDNTRFINNANSFLSFYSGEYIYCKAKYSDVEVTNATDGKVAKVSRICSYEIETAQAKYDIALKYCEKETDNPNAIGLQSVYIRKCVTSESEPYLGDGLWTNGITVEA